MFKKLRIKFIAITMVMVTIVMALAFAAVCAIEYQRSYSVVQTALSDAANQAMMDDRRVAGNQQFQDGQFGEKPFHMRGQDGMRQGLAASQSVSQSASAVAQAVTDEAQVAGGEAKAADDGAAASRGEATASAGEAGAVEGGNAARIDEVYQTEDTAQPAESDAAAAASDAQPAGGDAAVTGDALPVEGDAATSVGDAGSQAGEESSSASESQQNGAPPFIGNRDGRMRSSSSLIPVAVYAVEEDGFTHIVPQVTTASISDDVLSEAMGLVQESADGYGTLGSLDLHYHKATHEGSVYYVFADTSYTDNWKNLAFMLAIVGLVTLVVFFVISLFYSRWALRPVREAWDSQRQFVADASHDLKTPITVVLANAAILLKHPERSIASESQWIESTQKEAETMQGLVNEMLELAQIEAGEKVAVEKEPLDFSDLVDGETLLFDAVALERNCVFDCNVDAGVQVVANEKQVEKMVSTLMENAFKYVDDGGSVGVTLRAEGRNAVLRINNTGSVISPDDLPHIFDRFYRTDKARTSGEGGFGLGLAIAREIARQHGGDITCTSSQEQGTTFTAILPLQ